MPSNERLFACFRSMHAAFASDARQNVKPISKRTASHPAPRRGRRDRTMEPASHLATDALNPNDFGTDHQHAFVSPLRGRNVLALTRIVSVVDGPRPHHQCRGSPRTAPLK